MRHPFNVSYHRHLIRPPKGAVTLMPSLKGREAAKGDFRELDWNEAFAVCSNLQEAYDTAVEALRETGWAMTEKTLDELLTSFVRRLSDGIDRHDAPWFSRGIRRELRQYGIPVTKREELDAYFESGGRMNEARHAVARYGAADAARMTAEGALFESASAGNFSGYRPDEILSSWRRLGIC